MIVTLYRTDTGEVTRQLSATTVEAIELQLDPDEDWIKGAHLGKRVNLDTCRANKLLTLRPNVSGGVISGLPEGTMVRFDDGHEQHAAERGRIDASEAFRAHLSHPLHAPLTVRVRDDVDALRRAQFPAHGEQLGALVKAVKALMAGEDVPDDALAVIAEVDAVKKKLPKT